MPYMICKKCDVYYEIADESVGNDLRTCQCGSKMKYYDKIEYYLNSKNENTNEKQIPITDRLIMDYESAISRIILQCMVEIPIELGIKRIMLVLKGKKSPFIKKYELDQLKTYAILSNFSEKQLRTIIDSLNDHGFIKSEYVSEYEGSNIQITEKGKKFIDETDNMDMGFMKKIF